jgi:hypothetical protein
VKLNVAFKSADIGFAVRFGYTEANLGAEFKDVIRVPELVDREPYQGDYTITPKPQQQTLLTRDKLMQEDLIINPIPKEYGLVTYDNRKTITVS